MNIHTYMKKTAPSSPDFFHPKFVGTAVVGERGQIVIPKEVRDEIGLTSGSKLIVLQHPKGGIILLPAEQMRTFLKEATKHLVQIEKMIQE